MLKRVGVFCCALCFSSFMNSCNADVYVGMYTGVSNGKAKYKEKCVVGSSSSTLLKKSITPPKLSVNNSQGRKEIENKIFSGADLITYYAKYEFNWGDASLIENQDFTLATDDQEGGFGVDSDENSLNNAAQKISALMQYYAGHVEEVFKASDGFTVESEKNVRIPGDPGSEKTLEIDQYYLSHRDISGFKAGLFGYGKNRPLKMTLNNDQFLNVDDLHLVISNEISRNIKGNITSAWAKYLSSCLDNNNQEQEVILGAEPTITADNDVSAECNTKNTSNKIGMVFAGTFGFKKVLNSQKNYSPVIGAEFFLEFNPSSINVKNNPLIAERSKISVNSNSFGIMPFFGISKGNSWSLYGLCTVRVSYYKVKETGDLNNESVRKNRIGFGIGIGGDFYLSEKLSLNLRFINEFNDKININFNNNPRVIKRGAQKIVFGISRVI